MGFGELFLLAVGVSMDAFANCDPGMLSQSL